MPTNPNLKHVYDNSNKVTDTGLSVSYRQTFNGQYWEVTRMAKKQYQFIGMDKDTAYECAAAKRTQYTRAFSRIDTSSGAPQRVYAYECPSDIAPQHRDGDVWSVSISVNEQDVVASQTRVTDPASLFTDANARNYDEDAGASSLTLDGATRSGGVLTVNYSQQISGFNAGAMVVQYKTSESSDSWTSVVGPPYAVPETGQLYVRLAYGGIESGTIVVE